MNVDRAGRGLCGSPRIRVGLRSQARIFLLVWVVTLEAELEVLILQSLFDPLCQEDDKPLGLGLSEHNDLDHLTSLLVDESSAFANE